MSNKTTITADPGSPILTITRVFDAPREKVFRAFTQKDTLAKWWSPWGEALVEVDPRAGGAWRFTDRTGGQDVTFFGYYHDVTAPERIVQTEEFADLGERGHVVLDRYDFNELEGSRTQVVMTSAFLSTEGRDAAVQTGMEKGIIQQHENLDKVLKEMKS